MAINRLYQVAKNAYHFFQAHGWRLWYGRPDRGLAIYGVTGTNGKTTTCIVLGSILRAAYGPEKVGLLTTIVFWLGAEEVINETKMTTLKSREVFRHLRSMRDTGVKQVVMEITSHALDQHRLAGIRLQGAIITNVAREHLDYHKTMEDYLRAKTRIVQYLRAGKPLVLKGDDERLAKLARELGNKNSELQILTFTAEEAKKVTTPLLGDFNRENVLAAMKLAQAAGFSSEAIQKGVAAADHVPGRMEWVEAPKGFQVVIDYAVTPDALEKLYRYVREKARGKVYGVLGAAGLRDRGKRPEMARVVASLADELVLTREDPWTESEEQIFQDLEKGLTNATIPWQRLADRREALRTVLARAQAGDVVVTTGKGAERGMAIGKEIVPWHEREIIEELLRSL